MSQHSTMLLSQFTVYVGGVILTKYITILAYFNYILNILSIQENKNSSIGALLLMVGDSL